MNNYYHKLAKIPAIKAKKMPPGLEKLARLLVSSGRFRVDTVIKQNFVRWNRPGEGVNMMFSHREIFDKNILPHTIEVMRKALSRTYAGARLEKKIVEELERLRYESKKNIEVDADTEIKLARIMVQSAEPPVIMLLLAEKTEVFVSYSYSVGDMLDMQSWQEAGDSSGLQATDNKGCAVFVSCGGNPLIPEKKVERENDGFNALSRMVVIAGQELAHYSDIIREGRMRGSRFSADVFYGRASEIARRGRLADMENIKSIWDKINNIGLKRAVEAERTLKFFQEHRKRSFALFSQKIKVFFFQKFFIFLCKKNGFDFLRPLYKEKYTCSMVVIMLEDMLFNLQPEADAYKRPNPVEEEMIMCIEALARVQQQANKWGIELTNIMYPNLYKLYYHQILPSCILSVERITGNAFPEVFKSFYNTN